MAHELTHVINRDVMVMTLASFFATLASLILQFAFFFGGGGDREEEEDVFIVVIASLLVYALSFLLLRALSRYREFAADRGGAVLTGRPSALASALIRISGTIERVPTQDLRTAEGMSAFFIIPSRRCSASSPSCSAPPETWACATSSPAATRSRAPRPTACSRSRPRTSRCRPSTRSSRPGMRRSCSRR
jgi:heat shock protein HtpX